MSLNGHPHARGQRLPNPRTFYMLKETIIGKRTGDIRLKKKHTHRSQCCRSVFPKRFCSQTPFVFEK